jgi:hypothetical protein
LNTKNQIGISRIVVIVIVTVILIFASAAFVWFAFYRSMPQEISTISDTMSTSQTTSSTTSSSEIGINVSSAFSFNNTNARQFLESLDTPLGLLETYKGSHQIYIADDQALDYAALNKLGNQSLAQNISLSAKSYFGLYAYWNAIFVILNHFPSNWNFSFPKNYSLGTSGNFSISVTRFTQNGTHNDYVNYTDLLLYYSLDMLHAGQYNIAVDSFANANKYWNGYGFLDEPYNLSSVKEYTSYKLAVDLIVYKALMANSNTESQTVIYNSTLAQVQNIMSKLQGSDGGVITNYQIVNGVIQIPRNTFENGETTSLFVLAE